MTSTRLVLNCGHIGYASHESGERAINCPCGRTTVVRATPETIVHYTAERPGFFDLEDTNGG